MTACQQQHRALVKNKSKIVNPKEAFLADLEHELLLWKKKKHHEIIIRIDSNESVEEGKELKAFQRSLGLVDAMEILNPSMVKDTTYLWGKKKE